MGETLIHNDLRLINRMDLKRGIKNTIYFQSHRLFGVDVGQEYRRILREDRSSVSKQVTQKLLVDLLSHCKYSVPYYRNLMAGWGDSYLQDPLGYLNKFPILTKEIIRQNFEALKSEDLGRRKWLLNTTGGSTGEPSLFIQDKKYQARVSALQWLSHDWAGRSFGEPAIRVWASPGDIFKNTMGLKMSVINYLTNDVWFDGLRMSPAKMRDFIEQINSQRPRLIIGYVECVYELAKFAEQERLEIKPQNGIITSAGTLYPFMREKIEAVFGCKTFNRYGSREVGDIACECEIHNGMHVFPWGNYVEIVDEKGNRLPPGKEGNIAITNLSNYAMPLIRYIIGDRGILSEREICVCGRSGQILENVTGRIVEMFVSRDGSLIDGAYFAILMHMRPWIQKFQIIQKDVNKIIYRIVRSNNIVKESQAELDEIIAKTKMVMGEDCAIIFDFVEYIPPSPSGKFLFLFSEVHKKPKVELERLSG